MLIDLQLHSTYSDGYLTPTEVARFIAKQGVKAAALTDHNTVSGLDEFRQACQGLNIKAITGLEVYAKLHGHRFNILWYNFDDTDPGLHDLLRSSQLRRRRQMRLVLKKILQRGLKYDENKILDKYSHYVPVNRIVDDVLAVPWNYQKIKKTLGLNNPRDSDILKEYFHNRDFLVLKNSYIDMDRIMSLRQRIGGQIVLCHPAKHGYVDRNYLRDLKAVGLDGIELLSPHHSYGAVVHFQHLARELKLITTGGSDFHLFEGGMHPIQYAWQYYQIDSRWLNGINKIIE